MAVWGISRQWLLKREIRESEEVDVEDSEQEEPEAVVLETEEVLV